MGNAARDENRLPTLLGSGGATTVNAGLIDGVTGYLLVAIATVASFPAPASQVARRDENHKPTVNCLDENEEIKAMLIDDSNGGIVTAVTI